ncbi:MAG: MFS transporter [Pseudomonadota bacterium]
MNKTSTTSSRKKFSIGIGPVTNPASVSMRERYYVLFVLYIIYALNFLDRQILSILFEPMKADLQLSDTQLGFLSGLAFAMFYATFGIPVARLADRRSRRNIIGISLALWSGMTALCGMAMNFWQLTLARFGVAIGEAGCVAPAQSMLADYFPEHMRGRVMAIFASAIYVGILLGLLMGGWVSELYGWRIAFFVAGVPGILVAIVFMFTVREPIRGMEDRTPPPVSENTFWQDLGILLKRPTFVAVAIGLGLQSIAGYGITTWLPAFYQRFHDMSGGEVGTVLALIIGVGGTIGSIIGGWLSDALAKNDKRWYLWISAIAALVVLPFFFGALVIENTQISLVLLAVGMVIGAIHSGPLYASILGILEPQLRAVGTATVLFANNLIGIGLGSLIVGAMSDAFALIGQDESLRYSMLMSLVFLILAAIGMYIGSRTQIQDWYDKSVKCT